MALFGIFLAAYQLMSPTWKTIWAISKRFRFSVLTLIILGYTMPFISMFFQHPIHVAGKAIGSEQIQALGFVLLTLGFIDFARLMFMQKYKLLNARARLSFLKARDIDLFYSKLSQRILLKDYKTATDLLSDNVYDLVALASEHRKDGKDKKNPKPHYSDFAREILEQAFTDEQTMAYIVTHRFDFIHRYVLAISDNPYINDFKRKTAHELADALFKTKDSVLYRQVSQYRGSSRAMSIYGLLFGNKDILQVSRLFSNNRIYEINEQKSVAIDVYTDALITAIKSVLGVYLANPNQNVYYSVFENLKDGIYELLDISEHLAYMGVDRKLLSDTNSPEYKAFLAIRMFFGRYGMADSKKQAALLKASKLEREAKVEDQFQHTSLQSLMAYGSVELSKHICAIDYRSGWSLYDDMLMMIEWNGSMTPWDIKHNELFKEYSMVQIGQNLQGSYPVLFKGILCALAIVHPSIDPNNTGLIKLWKELKRILKNDLKTAILKNKKMADKTLFKDALLPVNVGVTISRKNSTVRYFTIDRSGSKGSLGLR